MIFKIFLCCFLIIGNSFSQESVFYSENSESSFKVAKFGLEVYNLNFIKNNEYFNFIADGYTLLGTQVHPEFIYNSSKNTQFKAGLFVLKNFGENTVNYTIPTFTFTYKKKYYKIIIGNLFSRNNHHLIEPLMASEKILGEEVLETGIEYLYKKNRFSFDIWLNWEKSIQKYDTDREEFMIGFSSKLIILKKEKHSLSIPLQYVYYHRGGQINKKYRFENNSNDLILNFNNASIGLEYYYKLNSKNSKLGLRYFYLNHKVNTVIEEFPFDKGNAHYFNVNYSSNKINFSVAYYKSDKFISAKGNDMFQSYSTRINNNYWEGELDDRYLGYTEPNRELLVSKLIFKKKLSRKIKLGLQFEGYYQLNNAIINKFDLGNKKNNFDYSYAIYILANDVFSFK
ncbi:MAG: hypothetical protein ACI9JT_000709 [Polaribacter sp.]|jgi:hypothetical protein